jgi:hypothetical protein
VIIILILLHSKNCHSKNFGTRDLRQANLIDTSVDLSLTPSPGRTSPSSPHGRTGRTSPPSPYNRVSSPTLSSPSKNSPPPYTSGRSGPLFSPTTVGRKDTGIFGDAASSPGGPLLRPTRMLSPTRGAYSSDSEQIDSADNTTDQGSDDLPLTPSHVGRSEGGLPRTMPLAAAGTPDRAASPTKRLIPILDGPATLGRANSFTGTGASASPGARRIAPLAASTTGTRYGAGLMGELRSTATGSPVRQWGGGTPQCPRCTKNVYFAEQVRDTAPPLPLHSLLGWAGI